MSSSFSLPYILYSVLQKRILITVHRQNHFLCRQQNKNARRKGKRNINHISKNNYPQKKCENKEVKRKGILKKPSEK
ncbi:hypothetical protein AKJ37_02640 [candidate division MSBL1 archaeon SCGC-AAA259I09]|uniref:Uncharacterized protein n=2 Tax=candidate division MSBL1 TaxID=215777 RepID=A0A133UU00_9EURY|nr:hypothetical protein AKJ37_02640 [candidate division MSBL1 archaeon SCGC-AAA259I09]KXB00658.1 hypothetical protein AKJ40_01025 [candidate division MSBL1 archaeon SCGC-AAA259M10]